MEKQTNTPKLRFPEFVGDWELKKLRDVISSIDSGVSVNSIEEPIKDNSEYGILKTSCISSGNFYPEKNKKILDSEISRASLNPLNGTIIISRMNTPRLVGESGYVDKDYPNLFVPDRLWMTKTNDKTDSKLLSIILSSEKIMSSISKIATGTSGTMKNISQPNFLNISVNLPNLIEQQRIASFFTVVNDKLVTLKKKKSQLEQYKNGIMQKLFSQELRFKDEVGNDYLDWDYVTLGEIAEKRISKNKSNLIKIVLTNSAAFGIVNQRDFFDKDIANQENLLNYYIVEQEDFVYNPRISNLAPVGPIGRNHLQIGVMSPLYSVFRFCKGNLDFFEFYFSSSDWHDYMKSIANYGARADRMSITNDLFYQMPLPFPSLPEQQKIASFLFALDDKIAQTALQIEKMQLWKKGLLQQMFV